MSATHETAGNMEILREAAIKAGADTAFSAEEAAQAIEALAKAGVSTKDILSGGLNGAMSLAAAGGLSVASAAETAAAPCTITAHAQLASITGDCLIRDAGGALWSFSPMDGHLFYIIDGAQRTYPHDTLDLPATVIELPDPTA